MIDDKVTEEAVLKACAARMSRRFGVEITPEELRQVTDELNTPEAKRMAAMMELAALITGGDAAGAMMVNAAVTGFALARKLFQAQAQNASSQ